MRFVGGYTGQVSTLLGCGGRDGGRVLAQGSENEFPFRAVLGAGFEVWSFVYRVVVEEYVQVY